MGRRMLTLLALNTGDRWWPWHEQLREAVTAIKSIIQVFEEKKSMNPQQQPGRNDGENALK